MKIKYRKYNDSYLIRITSEELSIIRQGLSFLPQINQVIDLRNNIDKIKLREVKYE